MALSLYSNFSIPATVYFGNYDTNDFKNTSFDVSWFTIKDDKWQIPIANLLYNNNSLDTGDINYAYFDTLYNEI